MDCSEIQTRLTDYVAKETGRGVSDTIRIHLKSCAECRHTARELNDTLDILKLDSEDLLRDPTRLSEKRRARITRSYRHPFQHWIESNHIAVSLVVALVIITLLVIAFFKIASQDPPQEVDHSGVPVWIGEE